MPWVNGRFYANLLYGRALERAREFDRDKASPDSKDRQLESREADANAHWVTVNGHHVFINETEHGTKQRGLQTHNRPKRRPGDRTARIIFNETSGLRPANGNSDDLHDARMAMAHAILNGRSMRHRPSTVTDLLTPSSAEAILTDPEARAACVDAQAAVREAASSADDTKKAVHFLLDSPGANRPNWATDDRETANYGPFINAAGGGDVKHRAHVTVRIYTERPQY